MRVHHREADSQAADSPEAEEVTLAEAAADSDLHLLSDIFEILKSFQAFCFDVAMLYEDHGDEA